MLQFLRAVSHAVGAHTESLQPSPDGDSSDDDEDARQVPTTSGTSSAAATVTSAINNTAPQPQCGEVCLTAPIDSFALVPCGHARFCETCVVPWHT